MSKSPKTTVLNAEGVVTSLLPLDTLQAMIALEARDGALLCVINYVGIWEPNTGNRWEPDKAYRVIYEEPTPTHTDTLIAWKEDGEAETSHPYDETKIFITQRPTGWTWRGWTLTGFLHGETYSAFPVHTSNNGKERASRAAPARFVECN